MLKRALTAALLASVLLTGSFVVPLAAPAVAAPAAPAPAAAAEPEVYRIMPLGDSITRGGGQVKGRYIGYRAALQQYLSAGAPGFRYDFVGSMSDRGASDPNHEGHGGWTIDNLAAHVDDWLDTHRPDVVLLHAGTNNITAGDSPAEAAAKLRSLIVQIRSHNPDMLIFVAKVIKSRDPGRQPRTNAYQNLIPDVVAASGDKVYLVDQSTIAGQDIYDWTHPNALGYIKMAYNWYTEMDRVIGGGAWKPVRSPYLARRAYVCQLHYDLGGRRICATRAL